MTHWPTKPLGEVCEFIRGITFKPTDLVEPGSPDSVACFRTKNIQASLEADDLFHIPRPFVKNDHQFVREGDVLISTANSNNLVGKCCFVPLLNYQATLGGFIAAIRAKPTHLQSRFLYYWLSSPPIQERFRGLARQTTNISNLPLTDVAKEPAPVPPLAEQERIVKLLDEADELRNLRAQADRRTADLIPALFHETFNDPCSRHWKQYSLGDPSVIRIIDGDRGRNYPKKTDFSQDGHCLFLNTGNVREGFFDFSDCDFITQDKDNALRKGKLIRGDVILTTRGTIGNSAHYDQRIRHEYVRINSGMVILRVNRKFLLPEFLLVILNSHGFTNQISAMTSGSAQPQLPINRLSRMTFVLPPLTLQQEFGKVVTDIRWLKANQVASRERLDALFQSMLHRAFRGEL